MSLRDSRIALEKPWPNPKNGADLSTSLFGLQRQKNRASDRNKFTRRARNAEILVSDFFVVFATKNATFMSTKLCQVFCSLQSEPLSIHLIN